MHVEEVAKVTVALKKCHIMPFMFVHIVQCCPDSKYKLQKTEKIHNKTQRK